MNLADLIEVKKLLNKNMIVTNEDLNKIRKLDDWIQECGYFPDGFIHDTLCEEKELLVKEIGYKVFKFLK